MTEIQQTTDYDQFDTIIANREVDQSHVNQLIRSIRQNDLLHINPIIVNKNKEVIDGQHRLEAAKQLKKPIYFIQDDKVDRRHIANLNTNQKNWSLIDYVNYYCVEKVQEFLDLSRLIRKYPFAPISTLITITSSDGSRNMIEFRNGKLDLKNYKDAVKILDHINKIRNLGIEEAYDRNFILAIWKCWNSGEYDPLVFLDKVADNRSGIFKCAKTIQYIQLIETVYNRYSHTKIRFY